MNDKLWAYLASIDTSLLDYLDEEDGFRRPTVEHLYRYGVALLQRLITPAHVMEDWEDFFDLAGGFVFAHGSERLARSNVISSLLVREGDLDSLSWADQALLVDLVRELGEFLSSPNSAKGGGTTTR